MMLMKRDAAIAFTGRGVLFTVMIFVKKCWNGRPV